MSVSKGIGRILLVFGVLATLFGVFGSAKPVFAADSCTCICSAPGGSVVGSATTTDKAASVCPQNCAARGNSVKYLECATDSSVAKQGSARCWTQSECENRKVDVYGESKQSVWDSDQPNDCPASYHYCYNPSIPVNLNIAIDTLENPKQAANLGEYITALYDLLLPVAAFFAVVLMMIAGLQYIVAGGNQTAISKAKDRITNAVVGLVLVMFAYVIVYAIDPRLTSFNALKVPVLKGALFIDENASCEALRTQIEKQLCSSPYDPICKPTVDEVVQDVFPIPDGVNPGQCGSKCRIAKIPDGLLLAGNVEVGDEFFYRGCQGSEQCVVSGFGETATAQCIGCWDVNSQGNDYNITPSASVCAKFDPIANGRIKADIDGTYETYGRCFVTSDADVVPGAAADWVSTYLAGPTCAAMFIDCSQITRCEHYGATVVVSGPAPSDENTGIVGAALEGLYYLIGASSDTARLSDLQSGQVTYKSICQADPCGLKTCSWNEDNPNNKCEGASNSGSSSTTNTSGPKF